MYTNLIPEINISGLLGTDPKTLNPANLLIFAYKIEVEADTPKARPKFLIKALVPPAIPSLSLGTEDIIRFVFGDWNNPFEKPNKDNIRNIDVSLELLFNDDNKIIETPVKNNPIKVSILLPILSDNVPLSGAITNNTIG